MEFNRLTAEAYTSQDIFNLEQKNIFSDCWYFCGLAEDLTEPFQYMTVQAGNNNLLIYKDEQGELQALHNICRHRGMQLVEGSGTLPKKLVCPYHDWTYNQKGELKSLPKQNAEFSGLDKACLSLKPALAGIWRGMIWVHPNINAPSLQDHFAPMETHLAPYDISQLIEAKEHVLVDEIHANWKLVVENYIDHYHLAQLHSGSLSMYDHKNAQFGFANEHFYFWEPVSDNYKKNIEQNSPYPLSWIKIVKN